MFNTIALFTSVIAVFLVNTCTANVGAYDFNNDKIIDLPGASKDLDFSMYSGYLDVTEEKKLFYWLNTCVDDNSDKLVIWLNGGPGCSSLDGFFTEHGPFKFNEADGTLEPNTYSWNKLAHTLYIEAPAGVGFSYDLASEPINDDTVSQDILKAITNFFERFSFLRDVDVYISGESYAGIYVPTLASVIIDSGTSLTQRVKGFMIGNGLLNQKMNDETLVFYAYYHGLFGSSLWKDLLQYCCQDSRPDMCDFYQFKDEECMIRVAKVIQIVSNSGLNIYNLYHDCASGVEQKFMKYFKESMEERLYNDKILKRIKDHQPVLNLVPPCSNATFITSYLNRMDVQKAIHVPPTTWEICSDEVHANYRKIYHDMTPFVKKIIDEMDSRILLYFGDVDMACNYMGGEWFTDQLGYKIISPRRSWTVTREDGSEQIAGFVKAIDKLTFATVKGGGHMVPTDQPRAAFLMIQRFLDDEPF